LPLPSVTVSVTVFAPLLAQVNVLGVTVREAIPQLSLLPSSTLAAVIEALPAAFSATVKGLHNAIGGISSKTVKVVVQVLLLPLASLTVTVIVFVPIPTSVPAPGFWVTTNKDAGVQLSEASTSVVTFGTGAWQLESASAKEGVAQLAITGATVSVPVTVTVNEHAVPTSVEQVTVIVPTGKTEPDGGLQLQGFGFAGSPQLPDVEGSG
jgi:hypothetical protein